MKSKTSCFNKTIFLKNITRFWPMWVLYLIILFFLMPMTLYHETKPNLSADYTLHLAETKLESMVSCAANGIGSNIFLTFFMAIGCAVLVFGYLFQSRNCNMIHALPVQRKELFATNYLSGILFLIVPQIIAFLMSLVVCVINNVTCVEYLLYWLMVSIALSFLFYSLASFCCMLTGNAFAALVYFVVGNLIYIGIKYLIGLVIDTLCYGLDNVNIAINEYLSTKDAFFSPVTYLFTSIGFDRVYDPKSSELLSATFYGGAVIGLYMIVAVIALIAAYLFYKKRHLECAGDVVTFKWMNPIFRWAVAFCFGLGLSLILANIFFSNTRRYSFTIMLFTIILTLVCFFVSEMILKKSFRIFSGKRWIEGIICTVLTVLLICACKADLFHVERRVPAADQVSVATLEGTSFNMVLTDEKEIQALIDIHQSALDHKKEYQDFYYDDYLGDDYYDNSDPSLEDVDSSKDYVTAASVNITYYLKNGKSFRRYYLVPLSNKYLKETDSTAYKLSVLEDNPNAYLQSVICKNYSEVSYESGYIDFPPIDRNGNNYQKGYDLTKEQAQTLYEAMEKDINEGNYPIGTKSLIVSDDVQYYSSMSFTGRVSEAISIYDILPDEEIQQNYSNYDVYFDNHGNPDYAQVYPNFELYSTCTNTIQAMIDLGIIADESDLMTWSEYYEIQEIYAVG